MPDSIAKTIMTPIPATFKGRADQKGYLFTLLRRHGDVCLFQKHNPAHKSGKQYWEVVVIRHKPKRAFPNGKVLEAHEAMPSPAEWGSYGWTMGSLSDGLRRYGDVIEQQTKPQGQS